jgi:putative transposase
MCESPDRLNGSSVPSLHCRRYYLHSVAREPAELLDRQMEVLMTFGSLPTAAAKAATSSIPIVMMGVVDPVGLGLVSNLARPEDNLTGNTYGTPDLASKQLELLRDLAPAVSRIAFLWNPEAPGNRGNAREHHAAASALGLDLQDVLVHRPEEIAPAFEIIRGMRPDAVGRQNVTRGQISDAYAVLDVLWLLLTTVRAVTRARQDLVLENLLLRHQLAVLTRPTRRRSHARFRLWDKLLWIVARRFCADWCEHLSFVTPETVVRWHRQGWRQFWRWKSRSPGGRTHLGPEIRDLIATMSRDNRLWGTERIRGELLKLGIVVSNRSIRRYRWRGPGRAPTQNWRTFLRNHAHHLWAADLLSVPTLTFKTLYVLVFIAHGRRELVHVNMTANPTAAWVWRQLIEATPWGTKPRHLLRDDGVYGHDFRERARRIGIDAIATPIHAPKANAIGDGSSGPCAENVLTTSSCWTSSICGRC